MGLEISATTSENILKYQSQHNQDIEGLLSTMGLMFAHMYQKYQDRMPYILYQDMLQDSELQVNCQEIFQTWKHPFEAQTVSPYSIYAMLTNQHLSEVTKIVRFNRLFVILWSHVGDCDFIDCLPQIDNLTYSPNYQIGLIQSFASLAHKPSVAIDMWGRLSRMTLAEDPVEALSIEDFRATGSWYRVNRDVFTVLMCKFAHEGFYMLSKGNRNLLLRNNQKLNTFEDYKTLCC